MNIKMKSFLCGVIVGAVGLGGTTVFAAPLTKQLNAVFSINAVVVDGKTVAFAEDSKPFLVDGRTYLPVRAIAEALDKEVNFDSATSSVIISSKGNQPNAVIPEAKGTFVNLTKDMVTGSPKGLSLMGVKDWDTSLKDNAGRTHETGILFKTSLYDEKYKEDKHASVYPTDVTIDIGLIGEYTRFEGQLVLTENAMKLHNDYVVTVFADDKEIYRIDQVKTGSVPEKLDFEVKNVKKLSFNFASTTSNILSENVEYGIVDVKLYQ